MEKIRSVLAQSVARLAPLATGKRRRGRKRREQSELIAGSPFFDSSWYLETYPDVGSEGVDPALHFLESGWLEGRDPGPEFATTAYLKANPDVARSGLNPLLHFIEFGQSEGREVRGHRFVPWRRTAVLPEFGPAAEVFRGKAANGPGTPWLSWHRLSADDERLFTAGEWKVGYADAAAAGDIAAAFAFLERLSGVSKSACEPTEDATARLADAWYLTECDLRTRWTDNAFPFVVRAFQHDALNAGAIALVGDAIVESPLDIVDLGLRDPYSPVLFVIAEPEGQIRGTRLLAVPSLCRGGVHYPETLSSLEPGEAPDPASLGLAEARRLLAAKDSKARLVRTIKADGEGYPLCQPAFLRWLENVAGVTADASIVADAGTLTLTAEMIPAIHALSEADGLGSEKGEAVASLLVAGPDPSQPAMRVDIPGGAPPAAALEAKGHPAAFPRIAGGDEVTFAAPAAIRLVKGQALSEAELLVPAIDGALPLELSQPATITWMIEAGDWIGSELQQAAKAISLQSGPLTHFIGLIGEGQPADGEQLAAMFRGRVRSYRDFPAAVRSADTDLVAYLGPGVILHDGRTSAALAALLGDPAVASASCALVLPERRGKSWHVSVVDGGEVTAGEMRMRVHSEQAQALWRACYPVLRPPRDLWMARTVSAKAWFGNARATRLEGGSHLCTTMVTASYCTEKGQADPAPAPPPAVRAASIGTRILFG